MKSLILSTLVLLLAGCGRYPPSTPAPPSALTNLVNSQRYDIYREVLEGHVYFVAAYSHTVQLIHAESCTNKACVPMTLEDLRKQKFFAQ